MCLCVSLTPQWLVVELSDWPSCRYMKQLVVEDTLDGGQREAVLGEALPHDKAGGVDQRVQSPHWKALLTTHHHHYY